MKTALRASIVWAIAGACLAVLLAITQGSGDGWLGDFRQLGGLVAVLVLLTAVAKLEPALRRWIE